MTEPTLHFVGGFRTGFEDWLRFNQDEYLSVDTETTGLNTWHDHVRMVQFGDRVSGWAIPYEDNPLGREQVDDALNWCAYVGRPLAAHRKKFDREFLANAGHDVTAVVDDGKASAHLMDPTCSGLKEASERMYGPWAVAGEKDLKALMRKTKTTYATVDIANEAYWRYAALDPVLESRLMAHNEPIIASHYADLYEMELEVSDALELAETRGVCVDLDYCEQQKGILDAQIDAIKAEWDFINLGSGDQIAEALLAWGIELPLGPPGPKSGRRKRKTDEVTLEKYRGNELVDAVLRFRDLSRNAKTYFGAYLDLAIDGRIHTFIDTLGARTGRMSSRDPNLQNVPKASAGDYVRQAFMASPGHVLVSADFAQIEYRIFASACGEPEMIQAIMDGEDLHAVVARLVYDDASITKLDPRRDVAKNANFAEIFKAGLVRFADTAHITSQEARAFKKKYYRRFPKVKPFGDAVMQYAVDNGMAVDTKWGRRIPVDPGQIYAAINYLIQGTAADVLKRAIQRIARTEWIQYLILAVHDELIFDMPIALVERFKIELPALMEDREAFKVPLEIETSTMKRWGMKEAA